MIAAAAVRALSAVAACALMAIVVTTFGLGRTSSAPEPMERVDADVPFDVALAGRPSTRTFTNKDGLPQNAISTIVTDRNGMLWIGTKDGAASYDGRSWQILNMPPEIGQNSVTHILHASTGDTWFGIGGGGIVRRSADGTWAIFPAPRNTPGELQVHLSELEEPDGRRTIGLLTTLGFTRFVDGAWLDDPEFPRPATGNAGAADVVVGDDGVSELWVGLPDGRAARRRLGAWNVFPAPSAELPDSFLCFVKTSVLGGKSQLVASRVSGLFVFNGTEWIPDEATRGDARFKYIFRLCETRSSDGALTLWAAGIVGNVFRYSAGQWRRFEHPTVRDGGVWSLVATGDERATHALWIGTTGLGLVRLQFGSWLAFDRSNGLTTDSVYSILATRDAAGGDVLWIGTLTGGLVRFGRDETREVLFANGGRIVWVAALEVLEEGPNERIVAALDGGIAIIENGTAVRYLRTRDGVPGYMATSLLRSVDKAGRPFVWVGAAAGLCRLVGESIEPAPAGLDIVKSSVAGLAETEDESGRRILWVATLTGLVRFDGERATTFTMLDGMPSNAIRALHEVRLEDGARELWVGTPSGIARLSLTDPSAPIRTLSTTSNPALPNNMIYRIEEDASGRLYVMTNRGVARLTRLRAAEADEPEFEVTVFTSNDGMPNDECNTGASTTDHRGRIWIGTPSGAAVYDTAAEIVAAPSNLVFVRKSVVVDDDRPLVQDEELAHDRNHVVFEYALLSYNREAATRYRSQLVGYEQEPGGWSPDARREFNSLAAGSYTFRVWGRDATGNVTGPIAVSFRVTPPPWLTWWAISLYAVLLLGLGYVGVRWRLRSLARQNVQLEVAIEQRTRELERTVAELQISQTNAVEAERAAHEANLAKSVFLANMSHELRTPLNAVLGFAQLLDRTGTLGDSERHQVGIIRRSGEHLLGLINDVLSLAKIEAGKLELHEQPFSPRELLAATEAMTRVRAEAKELHLEVLLGDGFPPVVHGDDGKLRQILLNLLGNAVKFTDRGVIRLVADWRDGRGWFEVSDEGRGISEAESARLFVAFSQTASGRATTEGTGLGLAISRQIVQLMGGDIAFERRKPRGSTFRFDVPLPATDEAAVARDRRRVLRLLAGERRRRVLVVDDSTENRLLLVTILNSVGFDVREASDGQQAVEVAADWRPRVIFMDRRMPVMDGLEATRRIRDLEREEGRYPSVIVATTASVFEQERAEILASGFDELIIKPYDESKIFEVLDQLGGVRFEFETTADTPVVDSVAPDSIMTRLELVDPSIVQRLSLELNSGDREAASESAREIAKFDPELGGEIERLVREFRMEQLFALLERVQQ